MLRMNLVLASTSLTLGECVYVKIRSAAQKQCSRRQLYGKFCNLPQFIQFSCRPDSSVKYSKHRKFIIMKQFMRLILYVILDLFIQGGGAGTGLLWAAQVKFKWELSPYCISCKFDANAILGVTAPPLWTPSCPPRPTEVVATEAMEPQELHCSADQIPTHSRWFFSSMLLINGVPKKLWKSYHFQWESDVGARLYIYFSGSNALPGQSREGGTQRGKSQADPDKRHIWLQGLTNIW